MRKLVSILALISIAFLIHPLVLSSHASVVLQSNPSPDFDRSGVVDFADFLLFAEAFGSKEGQEQYESKYDLDGNGEIGILDFLIFADNFGKVVTPVLTDLNVAMPSPEVREAFDLSPFYQQWIDVEGLPVVASSKVNPYAVKEAAWLIWQMIGHRPEVLRAMAQNKVRFSVMAYNEMTTQIPEHSDLRPKFYWDRRTRGLGATPSRPSVSCGEENLLQYPGDHYATENLLIHEFSHAVHQMGLNVVDSTFDSRLERIFDAAMRQGLWQGAYASLNKNEYWAEGVQSYFDANRENDNEHNYVNTRLELQEYDPELASLIVEVFGDSDWRYTPPATRTHLPHLQGFNPQHSPTFEWPPELADCYRQLRDPNSDGCGEWVNLNQSDPSALSSLKSETGGSKTEVIFVNRTQVDIFYYWLDFDGKLRYYGRVVPNRIRVQRTSTGHVWLVKNADGRNLAVFQAGEKTGRALISEWSPELVEYYRQLRDPNSDGGDKWVDLNRQDPSALSSLKSETGGGDTEVIFVNQTKGDIFYYWLDFDGKLRYYGRVVPNRIRVRPTYTGHVWLVKAYGWDLAVFQAGEKTGRALISEWPPELVECHRQLRDPNSDGCGEWVSLNQYDPSALSSLKSETGGGRTEVIFVNQTQDEIFFYWLDFDGKQKYFGRVAPDGIRVRRTYTGHVWLVKNAAGMDLVVFQAGEKTGRALID